MDELISQLSQMKQVIASAKDEDKPGLQMVIDELEQLLAISNCPDGPILPIASLENSVHNTSDFGAGSATAEVNNDDEDEEYRRFQAEISGLQDDTESPSETDRDINEPLQNSVARLESNKCSDDRGSSSESSEVDCNQVLKDELSALEGMKCKAPHEHHWGQIGYYNAIVLTVEESDCQSLESIFVRVVFSQPVAESMLPCSYYMQGRCNFDDDSCKFSHGEVVSLSQLKEYIEPDFSKICGGSRVLAKYSDGLWYKATVNEVTDSGDCELKYDSYSENFTVPLHETSPLYHDDGDASGSESDYSEESDDGENINNDAVITSDVMFLQMRATGALGDWEKHTRGIGSKLMAKMGYVLGTGLGRKGEGRIEPVDAVVLPPGRSLDACMELKEKAGNQNIFSVEKRLKRQKKKEAQRQQREEEQNKERESVFNFLNTKLSLSKNKCELKKNTVNVQELNKDTAKNLSKKMLSLGQNINQVNKDIAKLKEGIQRHTGRDQETVDKMKSKLESMEQLLSSLKKSEIAIEIEQRQRSDKKKLSIF